jgi:hypothetical protein
VKKLHTKNLKIIPLQRKREEVIAMGKENPTVEICNGCWSIKRFDKFVDIPVEVFEAINKEEIEISYVLCPNCQHSFLLVAKH